VTDVKSAWETYDAAKASRYNVLRGHERRLKVLEKYAKKGSLDD
jgi:hypothetical protein